MQGESHVILADFQYSFPKLLLEIGLGEMDLSMAVFWLYRHWLFMLLFCLLISRVVLFYRISSFWSFGEHMRVLVR